MELINAKWLLILGVASAWTIFFSMFCTPGIRGWRNLGWIACFVLGIVMFCVLSWRSALVTWGVAGIFSGLVYFGYECLSYFKAEHSSENSKPRLRVIIHALLVWPIMLPEAVEYTLSELGLLKGPGAPSDNSGS